MPVKSEESGKESQNQIQTQSKDSLKKMPSGGQLPLDSISNNDANYVSTPDLGRNTLSHDQYLLQYGPRTLQTLIEAVQCSFKLFWDGCISCY